MLKLIVILAASFGLVFAGEPARVKGSAQQKKLVHKVAPVYPPDAKEKNLSGSVLLEALIAEDGKIKELKVRKGEEPFVGAALEAVRQWVYEPTKINGAAVEVITEIAVNFKLSQP